MKGKLFPGWFYFFAVTFSAMCLLIYVTRIVTGHGTTLDFLVVPIHAICFWGNLRFTRG